jgi:hypothetical protein
MTIAILNSSLYLSNRAKLADIYFCCKGLIASTLNPKFEISRVRRIEKRLINLNFET